MQVCKSLARLHLMEVWTLQCLCSIDKHLPVSSCPLSPSSLNGSSLCFLIIVFLSFWTISNGGGHVQEKCSTTWIQGRLQDFHSCITWVITPCFHLNAFWWYNCTSRNVVYFWSFIELFIRTTMSMNFHMRALSYTTPTLASAIINSIPAMTFILSVILR